MEFLLEHQVIIMPAANCLVITSSKPTVVQTDLRQPKGLRTISAMQLRESRIREDTRCVVEKYEDGKRDSLPMSASPTKKSHRMASQSHLDSGDSQGDCQVQDSLDLQKTRIKNKISYGRKRMDGWVSTVVF